MWIKTYIRRSDKKPACEVCGQHFRISYTKPHGGILRFFFSTQSPPLIHSIYLVRTSAAALRSISPFSFLFAPNEKLFLTTPGGLSRWSTSGCTCCSCWRLSSTPRSPPSSSWLQLRLAPPQHSSGSQHGGKSSSKQANSAQAHPIADRWTGRS